MLTFSKPDSNPDSWGTIALRAAGLDPDRAVWTPLSGGRVNRVWRVKTPTGAVTVKLYGKLRNGGLFPNLPWAEAAALAAQSSAPDLIANLSPSAGTVLVYRYVPATLPPCPRSAGHALRVLHDSLAWPELKRLEPDRWRLLPGWTRQLRARGLSRRAVRAIRHAQRVMDRSRPAPCPLHGDPVPANILTTRKGPVLIDWQCPAFGDPATDLALYLSPAMQVLYGAGPLPPAEHRAFAVAYGRRPALQRYRQVAPALHARIAVHCARRGDRLALTAEIAGLNAMVSSL